MARALVYAPEALDDLNEAALWLTQLGSGWRARQTLAAIRADIRQLAQAPCRWPVGPHPGVRERPCTGGWRALYRVVPDTGSDATAGNVRVLRVYGPGQDRRGFSRPADRT